MTDVEESSMHVYAGKPGLIAKTLTAVAAGGLLIAGCSSGSSNTATAPTVAAQPTSGSATSGGGATSAGVTVTVKTGPMGAYLTDASGRTLYVFAADKSSSSTCYNACATYWPPLTTKGAPQANGSAKASLLGTSSRTDGATQVTYAGHPLYYYKGDAAPGDTGGQGLNQLGGLWWIVAPTGSAITASASSGSVATTSGSTWS